MERGGARETTMFMRSGIVEVLVAGLLLTLAYFGISNVQAVARMNCCFPPGLEALPGIQSKPNSLQFTPFELNRSQPQLFFYHQRIKFVGAEVASDGPDVISVNPIDRFTWAAVALGVDGHCYATLTALDPQAPGNGQQYYARFRLHSVCKGAVASVDNVRLTQLTEGLG